MISSVAFISFVFACLYSFTLKKVWEGQFQIVLNDNTLSKNPSNYTIKAFENFNSTFLVHSSLEKDKPITVNWLEEIGFTSENLLKTKAYRK